MDRNPLLAVLGFVVLAAIILAIIMLPFAFKKTPIDKIGLSYGGGPIEGAHFQGIHDPGSGLFMNGFADKLYLYPVTQRSYIIARGEGDISGVVSVPSQDRVQVDFEVATYFKLNLSLIQNFHENIGLKYHAWQDEGWDHMLSESLRQQIVYAIQREARQHDVADIYADEQTLLDIQTGVGTTLKENVTDVLGEEYFCGVEYSPISPAVCPEFTFVIKRVDVPPDVKTAFESNRTSEILIDTRRNEVEQARLEADAIRERQEALESCGQACVLYEAIKAGEIKFWVIPSGTGFTLQGPQQP